ncbi:hypothetical protein V8D89_011074 [Ganoderma adspersum]
MVSLQSRTGHRMQVPVAENLKPAFGWTWVARSVSDSEQAAGPATANDPINGTYLVCLAQAHAGSRQQHTRMEWYATCRRGAMTGEMWGPGGRGQTVRTRWRLGATWGIHPQSSCTCLPAGGTTGKARGTGLRVVGAQVRPAGWRVADEGFGGTCGGRSERGDEGESKYLVPQHSIRPQHTRFPSSESEFQRSGHSLRSGG